MLKIKKKLWLETRWEVEIHKIFVGILRNFFEIEKEILEDKFIDGFSDKEKFQKTFLSIEKLKKIEQEKWLIDDKSSDQRWITHS